MPHQSTTDGNIHFFGMTGMKFVCICIEYSSYSYYKSDIVL